MVVGTNNLTKMPRGLVLGLRKFFTSVKILDLGQTSIHNLVINISHHLHNKRDYRGKGRRVSCIKRSKDIRSVKVKFRKEERERKLEKQGSQGEVEGKQCSGQGRDFLRFLK